MKLLLILSRLTRVKVCVAVVASCAMGYLAGDTFNTAVFVKLLSGIFFLSSGASALNQFQEVSRDKRMLRTGERPLVTGALSTVAGFIISTVLLVLGFAFLAWSGVWMAFFLTGSAVLWYNGFYTPFKKYSAFAVFPGALIGAVPPVAGLVAAGVGWGDMRIPIAGLFFFMWQVPHFWLIQLSHAGDYTKAGFPILANTMGPGQVFRVCVIWILATLWSGIATAVFFGVHPAGILLLFLLSLWCLSWLWKLRSGFVLETTLAPAGMKINIYMAVVTLLVSLNGVLGQLG
ncbi:MAG: UbiA family prenyltransferase [Fibrobacteria bacterium]|nr:UbiA family prenyltransferase [Fibrobacteria bacterium]